jgi:hypothetical protein
MPAWAVTGVWIAVLLVLFGASAAGLAVGGLTALGWFLWRGAAGSASTSER